MSISVYVALASSLVVGLLAPRLSRMVPPATGVRAIACATVVSAAVSVWALALLAATLAREAGPVIEEARRHGVTRIGDPVPGLVGVLAAGLLVLAAYRVARVLLRHRSARREVRRVTREAPGGELVIAESNVPYAVALSGRPGRIVVSSSLMRLLDADERRVVYAHERAHLRFAHHRWRACAEMAAAANPLLSSVCDCVEFLVERWADEDAAAAVGDRDLVARALARAALATADSHRRARLGFHELAVTRRVLAMRTDPGACPTSRLLVAAILVAAIATTAFTGDATLAFGRWAAVIFGR